MNGRRVLTRGGSLIVGVACVLATLCSLRAVRGQEGDAAPKVASRAQAAARRLEQKVQEPTGFTFMETSLTDVLDVLRTKHDIPFSIDQRALADAGVGTDAPVTLAVRDIRLESALTLLLDPLELDWVYRDEAVAITSKAESESLLGIRVYPVGDLLKRIGPDRGSDLLDVLKLVSEPEWSWVGGPASAEVLGGSLVVSARRPMHAAVARLLADVRRAYDPDAPPAEVSATERAALEALEKPLNVGFENTTLADACENLGERTGTQILLRDKSLKDAGLSRDEPVSLQARDITLRSALNRLLSPLDLTWVIRNEVPIVLTKAEYENWMSVRVYPLGDLERAGHEEILELITSIVASTAWGEGNNAPIAFLPGLMIVSQTDDIQDEIAELLQQLHDAGPLPPPVEVDQNTSVDGYHRVVYMVRGMSPDDVASAIKATIAPDSWQAGKGSIHIIRADAAKNAATDRGGSGESGGAGSPAADVQGKQAAVQAQMGGAGPAPGFVIHRLVVIQRSDTHAQIQKLLHELGGFGSMGGGMGGGGMFRLRAGR